MLRSSGAAFPRGNVATVLIVLWVRWYVAYSLSLRNLKALMAGRGIRVDHSTVHRWVIKLVPMLEKAFRKHKRPVGKSWRVDETYVKLKGQWKFLYRAVDREGNTVDFLLRAHCDKAAARRYFEKAIRQNGEPETVTVDKSGANLAARKPSTVSGKHRSGARGANI
jgi:putative transposase